MAIGHPVQKCNSNNAQNKSKWGKRENQVGTKPPLKINTKEVTDHPDELTPNSEWR